MNYKNEVTYWKLFNVFVRFAGFVFFIGGAGIGIWGVAVILNPKLLTVALNVDDFMFKVLIVTFSLIFTLAGFFAMKLETYFPKHIKERMVDHH
jgi:hypothetical protein